LIKLYFFLHLFYKKLNISISEASLDWERREAGVADDTDIRGGSVGEYCFSF